MAAPDRVANRQPLVRLDGVGRTFQMGDVAVEVLRDVALTLYAGEFVAMIGPSGGRQRSYRH